jgi:hypothetical protein
MGTTGGDEPAELYMQSRSKETFAARLLLTAQMFYKKNVMVIDNIFNNISQE